MLRPAVLKKHPILVRPSFFITGLNFHGLPQSIIQLDLKLLSPQNVCSEGVTVSVVAQVVDPQASSLGRHLQFYPWCVRMEEACW